MVTEDRLATYEAEFRELREHLVRVLGAPTVNRLVERAAAEIARAHPGIASLRCEDDDLVFDGVRAAFAEAPEEDIRRSFAALYGVMVVIMARVLGRELAERLTEGLSIAQLSGAVSGYGRG